MPHKILLVDDDRLNIALVKFALADQRYDVDVAKDGEEGLTKLGIFKPDLIVLDVQMPNMSGFEFMAEIKKLNLNPQIPVIMLTANETMEDIFRLEGVQGYFVKPVNLERLIETIKGCLGPNPID